MYLLIPVLLMFQFVVLKLAFQKRNLAGRSSELIVVEESSAEATAHPATCCPPENPGSPSVWGPFPPSAKSSGLKRSPLPCGCRSWGPTQIHASPSACSTCTRRRRSHRKPSGCHPGSTRYHSPARVQSPSNNQLIHCTFNEGARKKRKTFARNCCLKILLTSFTNVV